MHMLMHEYCSSYTRAQQQLHTGGHVILYESCAPTVSAAPQCRTSLSYSLSVEFVCICDSPEPLSYRFRRRVTLAGCTAASRVHAAWQARWWCPALHTHRAWWYAAQPQPA